MKNKLFIIVLILLGVNGYCQKKIALLEPRVGGESIGVSSMEKAIIRGELRKAIVNNGEYDAFTRADIDQLMTEQNFQRTGMVNQSDIKKMGEMSGADYLLISTISKSRTEFYLEAYLIDIETGNISNPASQYGELKDGKLANMVAVCQALAMELMGITSSIEKGTAKEPINITSSVEEVTNETVSTPYVSHNTDEGICMKAKTDANYCYHGKGSLSGATWATTLITSPLIGIIPAFIGSTSSPNQDQLNCPEPKLYSSNSEYKSCYDQQAMKIKSTKAWGALAKASGVWLGIILVGVIVGI